MFLTPKYHTINMNTPYYIKEMKNDYYKITQGFFFQSNPLVSTDRSKNPTHLPQPNKNL